jgi:opacity protein-like surface antigen
MIVTRGSGGVARLALALPVAVALMGAAPAMATDWNGFYAGIVAGVGNGLAQVPGGGSSGAGCLADGTVYEIVGDEYYVTQWFLRPLAGGSPVQDGPIGVSFDKDLADDLNLTVVTTGKTAIVDTFSGPTEIVYDEYALASGAQAKALRNVTVRGDCTVWNQAAADYLENGAALLAIPYLGGEPTALGGDVVDGVPASGGSVDIGGFVGGARVGYMREFQTFVLGAEGEVFLSGIGDDDTGIGPFGMLTGRFGYKLESVPVLVFSSVGLAFGQLRQGGESSVGFGWSAGMGVEYQVTDTVSLRAETRHVDLSDRDAGMHASANLALVGVSFRF